MTDRRTILGAVLAAVPAGLLAGPDTQPTAPASAALRERVASTERAFARSMAERNHTAFAALLAEDAVFFGPREVLRGKAAVAAGWKRYFEAPDAPFSWSPDAVEVLDSGTLAFSSGPVLDPKGARVGTFNSVWRLERDGSWRIVFDKGCPPCAGQ
jgi:ketosteroid isomerase-like protein